MKQTFPIQNIALIISFFIITSCNMTGDIAIVKRKYMKGYNIETPLLIENVNKKTNQPTKKLLQSYSKKPITENAGENLLASLDSKSVPERLITISSKDKIYFPPDTTKPKNEVSNKKQTDIKNKQKSIDVNKINDKTLYNHAIFAFIVSCILPFISLLLFTILTQAFIGPLSLLSLLMPIFGIVLGFISLSRIKKYSFSHKGVGFAKAAIIIGFVFYALILLFYIWLMIVLNGF